MIVVVAAVIEEDGAFLVTRRQKGVHLAGLWEFPGGKIDDGETHAAALAREIREELDADVDVGDLVFHVTHDYDDRTVALYFYRCTLRGNAAAAARAGDAMGAARRARVARLSAGRRGADQAPDRIRRSVTVAGTRPASVAASTFVPGGEEVAMHVSQRDRAEPRRLGGAGHEPDVAIAGEQPRAALRDGAPSMRRPDQLARHAPCPRCSTRMITS